MKTIYAMIFFLSLYVSVHAQFNAQPLNYPGSGYLPFNINVVDQKHVWVGTIYTNSGYQPYSQAIKTSDGGESWQFFNIPVSGQPIISNVCAIDTNKCYYVFWDGTNGSIWKTEDGGYSWAKKTTTQFDNGYPNFYHAFSADTGVAMGDPNGGYFEIYSTIDGGDSWSRVPSANIPAPLSNENGSTSSYCASGNNIWFATSKGRCFKSIDKGLHWTVSGPIDPNPLNENVCFSNDAKGVYYQMTPAFKNYPSDYYNYWISNDGGTSWTKKSLSPNLKIRYISKVNGLDGGFFISAYDQNHSGMVSVLFTPDFFSTIVMVDSLLLSTGESNFLNSSVGWMAGPGRPNNNIYKYTSIPSSTNSQILENGILSIFPNPSSSAALLKLPLNKSNQTRNLQVFDIKEKLILEKTLEPKLTWTSLQTGELKNGLYFVKIFFDGKMIGAQKWIIIH